MSERVHFLLERGKKMSEATYPKFRWFVLVALVIVTAATSLTMITPAPLIPVIFQSLRVDPGVATAATMMTFNLVMAFFALLGGFLVDKVGVVRIWIFGLVTLMIGSLLTPVLGNSVTGLVIVRVLHGIGTGPIMGSIAVLCAQRFAYGERTYVAAAQGFAVSLGISIGFIFAPSLLSPTVNWQTAMAWSAIFPAIGLVFALIVLFGPKPPVIHTVAVQDGSTKVFSGDFKKALGFITIYVLGLMAFIDSWCQQVFNDMAPGYYGINPPVGLGLGPLGAGSKLMFASYAMMAGTLIAPVITEKIFKGNPKPTISIGCSIAAIAVFFIRFIPATNTALLILVPCIILFFSSFVNPTIFGYIAKNYPDTIVGRLGGFVMFLSVFGATVGLAISSYLLHSTGLYIASMNVLGVVTLFGAIAVWALKPPKGFNVNLDANQDLKA